MSDAVREARIQMANEQVAQQQLERRVANLVRDHDPSEMDNAVEQRAIAASETYAEQAAALEEEFTDLRGQIIAIRDEAKAGRLTKAQAVKRLSDLRRQYDRMLREADGLGRLVAANRATLAHVTETREHLASKYGLDSR